MENLEKFKDDCILFLTRNNQPICFTCLYKAAIPNSGPIEDLMLRGLISGKVHITYRVERETGGDTHHLLVGPLLFPHKANKIFLFLFCKGKCQSPNTVFIPP